MKTLSDPRRFRRLVAGFCFITAPLTLVVGAVVHPQSKDVAAEHLAVVAESPGRYWAAHAIILVGLVLFLYTILGLMHLLKPRAPALGHLGGGLAIVGVFGATAVVAVDGIVISQMGQPEASVQEMAALLDRIKESSGFRAIAGVGALSFLLGMLVLAYGLLRSRAAHAWVAAGIAAAAILFLAGQLTDNRVIFAIAFAVYLAALGPLGWKILTSSDEEWAGESASAAAAPVPTGAR